MLGSMALWLAKELNALLNKCGIDQISFSNESAARRKEKLTDVHLLDQFVQLLDGSTDEEERQSRKDMHRLAKETRAGSLGTRREIHEKSFREHRRSNHS
jgi:hypothetical protein